MSALAPWRVRAAQWRAQRWVLLVFVLLVAALTAAAIGLPRAIAATDQSRFDATLREDGGAAAEVAVGTVYLGEAADLARQFDAVLEDVGARSRDPFRTAIGAADWIAQLQPLGVAGLPLPDGAAALSLVLGAATSLPAEEIDGDPPGRWDGSGSLPVALERGVADALGVRVGDEFVAAPLTVRVSGVFRLDDGAAGRDHRAALTRVSAERLRDGSSVLTAGAWISPDALAALGPQLTGVQVTGWLAIDPDRVADADRDELAASVRAATSAGASLFDGQPVQLSSRLPTLLERLGTAEATAHALVWLLSAGWLASLVAAIVMTALSAARARDGARALLRARGAATGRMLGDGVADLVLLSVPGAAIGALAASIIVPGPLAAAVAIAVTVIALCGMLGGAVVVGAPPRLRPVALVAGGLVVAIGAAAVLTLRARGYAEGAELDPFLASAPATATAAVAVLVAAVLPVLLRAGSRALQRGRSTRSWLGVRWAARRGTGFALALAVLLAVGSGTTALLVGQAIDEGLDAAARAEVGADIRVDAGGGTAPPDASDLAHLAGVAAAAEVDALVPATVTDGGRLRAATVLVADTAALHEVRPDIPALAPGTALVGPVLAKSLGESGTGRGVEVVGVGVVELAETDAALPVADERWMLLDRASLDSSAPALVPQWTLVQTAGDAALPAIEERFPDAGTTTLAEVRASSEADATVRIVRGVLAAGTALPAALAVAAIVAAVLAAAREREDVWAAVRLTGASSRGRGILVLWQVGPLVLVGTAAGAAVGALLAAVIREATDLAAITGGLAAAPAAAAITWVVALPGVAGCLLLAAALAGAGSRPRSLAHLVRNGAP
ncbi:hypothetical protein ACIQLJ_10035 [Microbacterium sp. NPDC091313]